MHNADRPAKASADERLDSYKQSALAIFGAEKAEAAGQAVELLSDALSAVVAAQGFIPFATIEIVANAMGNAALALPVATIVERARIFLALAADREKYEATEQVPWPSEQRLLVNVLCETSVNLTIAREAIGVWSGMFNKPRINLKSRPYSVEEARAAISELIAPIEETLRTTGSTLSRYAEWGIQNEDGREEGHRTQQEKQKLKIEDWQLKANQIWKKSPDLSVSAVAKLIANEYPDDEGPSDETIRKLIKRPSRPNERAKKHFK